ncbi:DUF2997 domain-containing protein [Planctomicrobium piriforme]|uniref:DUF2997 domain-containing protein n=1 Tax=Planctomicrobium piriforme TaxID=1576369 RepID=A0A1I3S2Q5_9PLAN|nr:DUF2997 domain-containing protein [Planctomicrobium piriforme]SFJ51831.1 Protein of unknown function [Planctomicrobium piriforme]
MTQTIEILIAPDGKTRVETTGFTGATCRQASRFVEQALGSAVHEQLKPEFHQIATTQEPVREQQ